MDKRTRNAGIAVLAAAAAGAVAAWVIRDQMQRHSRDLFSSSSFRRLAALGYIAKAKATVDHINLINAQSYAADMGVKVCGITVHRTLAIQIAAKPTNDTILTLRSAIDDSVKVSGLPTANGCRLIECNQMNAPLLKGSVMISIG